MADYCIAFYGLGECMPWVNGPLIAYHGTILPYANDIALNRPTLSKCTPKNDFGLGFYLTTNRSQAVTFANNLFKNRSLASPAMRANFPPPVAAALVQFEIDRSAMGQLDALVFMRPTQDWAEFVAFCRVNGKTHAPSGMIYDVVFGPVRQLDGQAHPIYDQISSNSQKAIQLLSASTVIPGGPRLS